jgi:hypothetical protein
MGKGRGGRRERRGDLRFGRGELWCIMEEREGRGVKERIFSLLAHGLKSGATGQTGDSHRSDR